MNKLKLLFWGVLPFAMGYLLNYAITKYDWYGTVLSIISILFFAYWFFVGYKSCDYVKTARESILIGNIFAIVSIVIAIFQALILKAFMPNIFGVLSQMFYLPALSIVGYIQRTALFFIPTHHLWISFTLSFILMMAVYYAGYSIRLEKTRGL